MLIQTLWPVFALIVLGYTLARRGFPGAGFWPAAERINYVLLFPALLVASLAVAPVDDPALLRLGGATALSIGVAAGLLALLRLRWPATPARFGPALQGVLRFNTYLGLAIVGGIAGPAGLTRAAVFLAVAVPLVNVLSIMALSNGARPLPLLLQVLRNPLILACACGLALAVTGTGLPWGSGTFLGFLAQASLPLGLLCVGAALQPAAMRRDVAALGINSALRLAAMPWLAWGVGRACGLTGVELQVLVVFSAIPTATTAYVLTRAMGGDGPFMAGLITAQTLASALTLPLVLALLGV
ncbi:AEC family transporter [Loktanella fryxellensis]|uniref:AEC family transporter n=1 Tax=Loktanella fryxellensis TaxID=245187 RepID=UPI000B7DC334|nr:AEC family transporter [Loktanella fryxellensis]